MLSVMIYEPDEVRRNAICRALMQVPGAAAALKIVLNTGSAGSFARMMTEITGAALVILGMALRPENNRRRCLDFGSALARQSRDCYTVYDIYDLDDLPALLPQCSRPAGILLGQYTQSQASACFGRIISDYAAVTGPAAASEALVVESGTRTFRLPFDQILYIEALNKKLNICTVRQSITLRRSMNSFEGTLPDFFLRCHRSYIVNMNHVEATDYKEMLLTMSDGSRLPIARSMRDAFHQQFTRGAEDASAGKGGGEWTL